MDDIGPTGFDPTRPRMLEWQQILEKVVANLSVEVMSSRKSKKTKTSEEKADRHFSCKAYHNY